MKLIPAGRHKFRWSAHTHGEPPAIRSGCPSCCSRLPRLAFSQLRAQQRSHVAQRCAFEFFRLLLSLRCCFSTLSLPTIARSRLYIAFGKGMRPVRTSRPASEPEPTSTCGGDHPFSAVSSFHITIICLIDNHHSVQRG